MRPGLTTATQYSGAPLPLPIRVSAGFFVTGLSGNMRIQILPPRLMWRVIAIRAASICRSVIHAGSRLLSPYSPKLISLPRVATPVMRPRICFRCLTFFGINIAVHLIAELRDLKLRNFRNLAIRILTVGYLRLSAFFRRARRLHVPVSYVDVVHVHQLAFR